MTTNYDYQKISETLNYSLNHFEIVESMLNNTVQPSSLVDGTELSQAETASQTTASVTNLKERWQNVLGRGSELAGWVQNHHRVQSTGVYSALEELAKYSDVRRPFRLSVIGQKGVGKSALVNALLGGGSNYDEARSGEGAEIQQLTPSDVATKALSGTRIRLAARNQYSFPANDDSSTGENSIQSQSQPNWEVVFLTPRRLWEVGTFLLNVARLPLPTETPTNLNNRQAVTGALQNALKAGNPNPTGPNSDPSDNSPVGTMAFAASKTLTRLLQVYQAQEATLSQSYTLGLDDPSVDGPVSPYIRQEENDLYLIVDYVKRYLEPSQAGLLAGRNIELEDVLGLDDPRDSFFALEAFRESFAVIMVFKCDRPLNSETTSILQRLFSRDEAELAQYGEVADLNKAIIVANRFDDILGNVSASQTSDPLKAVEGIRRELAHYTRQAQNMPIYLTSASVATTAQNVLAGSKSRPSVNYNHYLEGLANLLQLTARRSHTGGENSNNNNGAVTTPDYLDYAFTRQAEIESRADRKEGEDSEENRKEQAHLILEMSGLPRLLARVEQSLESGSILRGRVANAEYYHGQAVKETALNYARQLRAMGLELSEFTQPAVSMESRMFTRFQRESRTRLEELDKQLKQAWFAVSHRYIFGPQSEEVVKVRVHLQQTIQRVINSNEQLIQMEEHIPTGQLVTDAWRKVFEDINDYLALEAGRQLRSLVGPLLGEIELLSARLQKELSDLATGTLDETFWANYRNRLGRLGDRLQNQAEVLALSYYTDHRYSVYDEGVARTLHVGDANRRRDEVARMLVERVETWFSNMWHLLCKVAMTDLNAFVGELRYYVLGLPARDSLQVGLELAKPGQSQYPPSDSLVALLDYRYQTDEAFRRHYALREPTPVERLTLEIRDWLGVIKPPQDGLTELGKAVAIVGVGGSQSSPTADQPSPSQSQAESIEKSSAETIGQASTSDTIRIWPPVPVGAKVNQASGRDGGMSTFTRLNVPVESRHPYGPLTRQYWDITNPDQTAKATRLHFSRIELGEAGTKDGQPARIVVESLGRTHHQIITGQHSEFWTEALPGSQLTVRFLAENARPGWGFVLDGVESVGVVATTSNRASEQ